MITQTERNYLLLLQLKYIDYSIAMKKLLFTSLMIFFIGFAVSALSFSGKWEGTLKAGLVKLRLVFNIQESQDGTLSATLDSPNQGATDIPCDATRVPGNDKIEINVPLYHAKFTGALNNGKIEGTFSQNGLNLPLTMEKVEKENSNPDLPQETSNQESYDYLFKHDGVTLAGQLDMPPASFSRPCPAVILISGSGTQDRDEALLGLKPFKVISDYLTSHGIAVFRYDDRGAGESSPLNGNETTLDFAKDAQAAFDLVCDQYEMIDPTCIGYIGHSEGGQIAFVNAASDKRVAFVVSLAGPAASGRDVMVKQNLSLLDMMGVPYTQSQVDEVSAIFDDIVNIADTVALRESLRKRLTASTLQHYTDEQIEQNVAAMTSPWYITYIRFNPKPYLEKITCPVLALNGEWDFQVDAKQTLDALKTSVKNVQCKLLPKHNHLFQECASKFESMNYATQGNISSITLDYIKDFIKCVNSKQ